ncbi:hypothetical protein DFH06DRAFT_1485743 [Mycena polygramma]|nr:hypothetical protein DFH06DRAFT_1485743 [Mycena polygramma]
MRTPRAFVIPQPDWTGLVSVTLHLARTGDSCTQAHRATSRVVFHAARIRSFCSVLVPSPRLCSRSLPSRRCELAADLNRSAHSGIRPSSASMHRRGVALSFPASPSPPRALVVSASDAGNGLRAWIVGGDDNRASHRSTLSSSSRGAA